MISVLTYLLKASLLLTILYAIYWLLLRKETFFSFNRFYLLAVLLLSSFTPLLDIDLLPSTSSNLQQPITELGKLRVSVYQGFEAWVNPVGNKSQLTVSPGVSPIPEILNINSLVVTGIEVIYFTGFAIVLIRLLLLFFWIRRLKQSGPSQILQSLNVVRINNNLGPFSFIRTVFVPQGIKEVSDLEQILAHERVHIQERHSYDLIFGQLLAAGLWFNPIMWQLLKSLKKTHEYIADKKTINQGYSLVTYQSLLLRQLISTNSFGLIHHFNLTFIKQRITMMNTQKSGWTGKVRVALSLFCAVVFSFVMMQCNTGVDEQVLQEPQSSVAIGEISEIDVPQIPASHFKLKDLTKTVNLTINENTVAVNGGVVELDKIATLLEEISEEKYAMILRIDHSQSMSLVREVQRELRRANRLKVLYLGKTPEGETSEIPLKLPPLPENNSGLHVPVVDDAYAKANNLSLLKIRMNESTGPNLQEQVYNFVKEQVAHQNTNYVVSARFSDNDTYGKYLESTYYLQKAFHQLYEERAQTKFGESFTDILEKSHTNEKYAELYRSLKKEAPMAISIAED